MHKIKSFLIISMFIVPVISSIFAQEQANQTNKPVIGRERLLMDPGWRFAFGHSFDVGKDFNHATGYFSYFTKAGYGDGPASKDFDDRAWRKLDLPHDWCVELLFDSRGGHSHGYKTIGRDFPQNSVGWYRKTFSIPESDLGKRISIEFDGVFRNSIVWVNGFYLGTEHSGYSSFSYDITDYLNYGGDNVVAVRVDATMEEGWFYEGAGIYRHVWLTKTAPLHVARHGTFITTELKNRIARVTVRTTVVNESKNNSVFDIEENIIDAEGKTITSGSRKHVSLGSGNQQEYFSSYNLTKPKLWSVVKPYLYKLQTIIRSNGKVIDAYETVFGIRTVRFDPNEGFFLNGKHLKILGTCDHQDHAGVGTAIPDALQEYRVRRLKEMGSNAIRTSHNPPTPEFLDACDRLGMLVLDENRLMGINEEHLQCLEQFIKRDRNHPSVILWSLGNEEWAIEGNIKGARITATMQNFARHLDSSRAFTVASSGGWDDGIGTVSQVAGFNYIVHGNIDEHHRQFPWQAGIGSEETNTIGTRGIYETDDAQAHMAPKNLAADNPSAEFGWKFYTSRPFLSGLFYWTGFDYRGESNPYGWPAVSSQYGILDVCGFPKDIFYYFKSWWGNKPVLHIATHWNWHEEKQIDVRVYSNCDEVELFLNTKSLGRKRMENNSHLEWPVKYEPGTLIAYGYKNNEKVITDKIETAGEPAAVKIIPDGGSIIKANGEDVSVITIQVVDSLGRIVPIAGNEISFSLKGPGKIIGVGNGDPSSHESDRYIESVQQLKIENLCARVELLTEPNPDVKFDADDSSWPKALDEQGNYNVKANDSAKTVVIRGTFNLLDFDESAEVTLWPKSLGEEQAVYINGCLISGKIKRDDSVRPYKLDHAILRKGKNIFAAAGSPLKKRLQYDILNTDPGIVQFVKLAGTWKRKVFNGLAQVIIQSDKQPGDIVLTAASAGLMDAVLKIQAEKVLSRQAVPSKE